MSVYVVVRNRCAVPYRSIHQLKSCILDGTFRLGFCPNERCFTPSCCLMNPRIVVTVVENERVVMLGTYADLTKWALPRKPSKEERVNVLEPRRKGIMS